MNKLLATLITTLFASAAFAQSAAPAAPTTPAAPATASAPATPAAKADANKTDAKATAKADTKVVKAKKHKHKVHHKAAKANTAETKANASTTK